MIGICHIEIPLLDLAAHSKFYNAVFGWQVFQNKPTNDYWFFDAGNMAGGFSRASSKGTSGIKLCFNISDTSKVLERVRDAGGKVVQDVADPGYDNGNYVTIEDPSGNTLFLWQDNA